MPNLTSVTVTAGIPTAGSGTVSTLDGIIDATNGPVAIKAASTAPVATDKALVVAISPNTQNANGQATMANSTPVVMASDFVGTSGYMKKEDVASADGDAGVGMLAVQKATPANTAGTDGDYEFLQISAGRLWASTQAYGDIAHDGVDSGNPVKVGAKATNVEPTAVSASGDRINLIADLVGKLIVLPYANPENFVSGAITTAMTSTTTTSLIAAPAAGLRNYITQITVSNAHATVGTDVIIQDGSGGTTLYTIPAAAVYGGAVITLPTPLRQPTTATAIFCANVTTGASTKVSASGYKGV